MNDKHQFQGTYGISGPLGLTPPPPPAGSFNIDNNGQMHALMGMLYRRQILSDAPSLKQHTVISHENSIHSWLHGFIKGGIFRIKQVLSFVLHNKCCCFVKMLRFVELHVPVMYAYFFVKHWLLIIFLLNNISEEK